MTSLAWIVPRPTDRHKESDCHLAQAARVVVKSIGRDCTGVPTVLDFIARDLQIPDGEALSGPGRQACLGACHIPRPDPRRPQMPRTRDTARFATPVSPPCRDFDHRLQDFEGVEVVALDGRRRGWKSPLDFGPARNSIGGRRSASGTLLPAISGIFSSLGRVVHLLGPVPAIRQVLVVEHRHRSAARLEHGHDLVEEPLPRILRWPFSLTG